VESKGKRGCGGGGGGDGLGPDVGEAEVAEDLLHRRGLVDRGEHAHPTLAATAREDVDGAHAAQS
jgi:hypothetical protein